MDTASFDIHRGIRPQGRRGDEAQDRGSCMLPAEMRRAGLDEDLLGRWGTPSARERVRRMNQIRAQRGEA